MPMPLLYWEPGHSAPGVASPVPQKRISSLSLLPRLCLMQCRITPAFCFCRGTLLAHVQLGIHQNAQGFSYQAVLQLGGLQHIIGVVFGYNEICWKLEWVSATANIWQERKGSHNGFIFSFSKVDCYFLLNFDLTLGYIIGSWRKHQLKISSIFRNGSFHNI